MELTIHHFFLFDPYLPHFTDHSTISDYELVQSTLLVITVPGGAVLAAMTDPNQLEAPVTVKAYLLCIFASFGRYLL